MQDMATGQQKKKRIQDLLAEITEIKSLSQKETIDELLTELQISNISYEKRYSILQILLGVYFANHEDPKLQKEVLLLISGLLAGELDRLEDLDIKGYSSDNPFLIHFNNNYEYYLRSYVNTRKLYKRFLTQSFSIDNSPHYIIAVPKTGSSVFGNCISNMLAYHKNKRFNWRRYPSWSLKQGSIVQDWELRPEIGGEPILNAGGIYKGHIEPSGKNLAVLDMYPESRYILWIRDPRDIIASVFCDGLRHNDGCHYWALFPVEPKMFRADRVYEGINYLINDGYLMHVLMFIGKWQLYRKPQRSIVLTYERYLEKPIKCLQETATLLGFNISEDILNKINEFHFVKTKGQSYDKRIHPLGWTGHVGTWKKYFSEENYKNYKKVFRQFVESFPWAKELERLYPIEN